MNSGPQSALLGDGRLHLQHGPIDLIIESFGPCVDVSRSYHQAKRRFETVLDELVGELPRLRLPLDGVSPPEGPTARRMACACERHGGVFITPMAAVAGAVADEVMAAMVRGRRLKRAYVNNGGDIALFLAPGESFDIGIVSSVQPPTAAGRIRIDAADPVRGVATSGFHGRSLSLGIADAVTVLAETAAAADAAATMIANAVDLPGHPSIGRQPARDLDPDSDLGARMATVRVGPLSEEESQTALEAGLAAARALVEDGEIHAAALCLNNEIRTTGAHYALEKEPAHA